MEFSVEVDTHDIDRARAEVAQVFCPHRLDPADARAGLSLKLQSRRSGGVGVSRLDYGREVRIRPGALESFFLVQIPLQGTARISHGKHTIESSPGLASVLSTGDPSDMRWGDRNPQICFYVDVKTVTERLSQLLGRPVEQAVRFDLGMDMRSAAAAAWFRGLTFLESELAQEGSMLANPVVARQLEHALVDQLLFTQPHSLSAELARPQAQPSRLVRRACDLIRDHHGEALAVGDVAEALNVSVRTLQDAFRRDLNTSPMTYLRERRLDSVREALLRAAPDGSVTTTAVEHGFAHLGRFSTEYRRRFGESPSTTLRR